MSDQFVVKLRAQADADCLVLRAVRDRVLQAGNTTLTLLHELPSTSAPTRLLIAGTEADLRHVLGPYAPLLDIEVNRGVTPSGGMP